MNQKESPSSANSAPSTEPNLTADDKPKRVVGQRKVEILQAMAKMLESPQWQKITTAALAAEVGFSEAALYRHFKGKAEMYSGLIDFIDESFIELFKDIQQQTHHPLQRLQWMRDSLLHFSENNRGLTRVLTGEALLNESESLNFRMNQILLRIEENWKILLKEAVLARLVFDERAITFASFQLNSVVGAWWRFSKSGFKISPSKFSDEHWALMYAAITQPKP